MADLTLEVLKEIRDEVRGLRGIRDEVRGLGEQLNQTNARLDQTNERLDQSNERLDQTNERLERLERRQVETEVRLATELTAVVTAIRDLKDVVVADRELRQDVADHERRIRKLEAKRA